MIKFFIALLLGAGLIACSDVYEITVQSEQVEINTEISEDSSVDSLIAPYRTEMSEVMDEVIGYAENDFVKGRPHGALNNWSADAILTESMDRIIFLDENAPVMCLLNVGGLRNPLSKGSITTSDIYKLMPFDNQLVWVEMPIETTQEIVTYMKASGGEPIAGARIVGDSLIFDEPVKDAQTFWVITSDYLMNGGDKMTFFEQHISTQYSGVLMRDAMMSYVKSSEVLPFDDEPRIQF